MKKRIQHPRVAECRDRKAPYWFFRYRDDEPLADGTFQTVRKRHIIGPSRGPDAIGKREAETRRDAFLAGINSAPSPCQAAVASHKPLEFGAILFGKLAEMWRVSFREGCVGFQWAACVAGFTRMNSTSHWMCLPEAVGRPPGKI